MSSSDILAASFGGEGLWAHSLRIKTKVVLILREHSVWHCTLSKV
jgi:hypothetical protein